MNSSLVAHTQEQLEEVATVNLVLHVVLFVVLGVTNITVIILIRRYSENNVLSNLVSSDCSIHLCCSLTAMLVSIWQKAGPAYACSPWCTALFFAFFTFHLLRLTIPVGIMFFRHTYVFYWERVYTSQDKTRFHVLLTFSILLLPITISSLLLLGVTESQLYLSCMGRPEEFLLDLEEEKLKKWQIPLMRLISLVGVTLVLVVYCFSIPWGYYSIYKFNDSRDYKKMGLSEESAERTRKKNIMSWRVNMKVYAMESTINILLILGVIVIPPGMTGRDSIYFFYMLATSLLSNIGYIYGIESVRENVKTTAFGRGASNLWTYFETRMVELCRRIKCQSNPVTAAEQEEI